MHYVVMCSHPAIERQESTVAHKETIMEDPWQSKNKSNGIFPANPFLAALPRQTVQAVTIYRPPFSSPP